MILTLAARSQSNYKINQEKATYSYKSEDIYTGKNIPKYGPRNTDVYKAQMAYYIWSWKYQLHTKCKLSNTLVPADTYSKGGQYAKTDAIKNVEEHVKKFLNTKFSKKKTNAGNWKYDQIQDVQESDGNGGTKTVQKVVNTWTYVGPYKISYKNCKVDSITSITAGGVDVSGSVKGWTDHIPSTTVIEGDPPVASTVPIHTGYGNPETNKDNKSIDSIPNNQEFWILISGDYSTQAIQTIIRSTEVEMHTGRIALMDAANAQNSALYVLDGFGKLQKKYFKLDLTSAGEDEKGGIRIIKYRTENEDARLGQVGFKIQKDDGTWLFVDANGDNSLGATPTEFIAGDNGIVEIDEVPTGNYKIYETKNSHYGYEIDPNTPIANIEVKSDEVSEVEDTKIPNPQKRTKISGYVWDDGIEGKNSSRDSVRGDGDKPIAGIRVTLWNIVDGSFREINTDSEGKYCFDDVLVDDVINNRLYVDFYYDGVEYAPVKHNINLDNGSKAVESTGRRRNLNKVFGVISNDENNKNHVKTNQNIVGDFTEEYINKHLDDYKYSLGYSTGDHSSLINTNSDEYSKAVGDAYLRTFARAGETSNDASVKELNTGYSLSKVYNDIAKTTVDSVMIENVNLGLYRREQPNISVKKDIDSAQLEINGYGHVYDYNGKDKDSDYQNQYKENLGVKFGKKWTPGEYQLPIYKSDYTYTTEDKSKELKAYITYKIELSNNSVGIDSKVNTLFDYYDKTYMEDSTTKISISDNKDELETNGRIKSKFNYEDKDYNDQYKKLEIDTSGITIEAGKTETIYVQFEFSRQQIYNIITSSDKDKNVLYNVAEVGSYASYYPADPKLDNDKQYKGQLYAGIDRSSSPGNATPGETKTYENDTDISPALKLEKKAEERSIEGKVFLDEIVKPEGYTGNTSDLMTGYERLGNGEYDETENGIDGVRVMLKSKTDDTRVYYIGESKQSDKENDKDIYTSNGGDFEISGFIPDEYELVYTWGGQQVKGETISVENYKGTIYKDKERYDHNQNDNLWYNNDVETRRSDAVDNMETRNTIDESYREVTWKIKSDIENIGKNLDKMNSTTPEINIRIENTSDTKDGKVNSYKTTSSGIEVKNAKYEIQNIDFGIVERAKQKVELTKRVKHLKLTLANGQTISEAEFEYDKNGKLKANVETKHMTFMGTTNKAEKMKNNGFIKLELDNELIQGSTLEVKYELLYKNNSEKDYWSDDYEYYKFGIKDNSEIIGIKPSRIVDYLDADWGFETDENVEWKVFNSGYNEVQEKNENINLDKNNVFKNANLYNEYTDGRIVLQNDAHKDEEVNPGNEIKTTLEVSKILTITDEIELENDTEIVKMEIPHGGRPLTMTRIPGQYYPGSSLTELSDKAERIMVTPSTGKDLNFVTPITIGVIALITLGAGVILIKKKVVDNK